MDFSLFSQNLVTFMSLIAAGVAMFIVMRLQKPWFGWPGLYMVSVCLAMAAILEGFVQFLFPTDQLPTLLWLMIVPFTLGAGLIMPAWTSRTGWLKWLAIGATVFNLAFSLALVNGYYRFYPTFYSLFNASDKRLAQSQTTVRFSQTSVRKKSGSIENSLYANTPATGGTAFQLTIPGTTSKFHPRIAYAYLPAIANSPGRINLPVMVLLPGVPGLTSNWLSSGLAQTMDQFSKLHHGITPAVFMVDDAGSVSNDTECVNSPRGNVEAYLTVDVPSYIKSHYEVSSNPSQWAIGGLSMGGMCAVMLALRHPDVYRYFLDFGGEDGPEVGSEQQTIQKLFYGSESAWEAHQPLSLLQNNNYQNKGMGGFFAIGNGDKSNNVANMNDLYQKTKSAGIESVYEEVGGQHTFNVFQESFKDSLPWVSNRLGATDCSSSCTY